MNQISLSKAEIADFVKRAQQGDRKAMEQLILVSKELIYNTCFRILKNRDDVEDIAQEVYIIIFEKIGLLKKKEAFLSWVAIITANRCKDFLRAKKTFFLLEGLSQQDEEDGGYKQLESTDAQADPEKVLDTKETQEMILDCIDKLPDAQRMCVILFYYSDLSINQIAGIMNVSDGTIKSRLNYARIKLKKMLEEESHRGFDLHGYTPVSFLAFITYFLNKAARQEKDKGVAFLALLESWAASGTEAAAGAGAEGAVGAVSAADAAMAKEAAILASGSSLFRLSGSGFFSVAFWSSAIGKAVAGVVAGALILGGTTLAYRHFHPREAADPMGLMEVSEMSDYSILNKEISEAGGSTINSEVTDSDPQPQKSSALTQGISEEESSQASENSTEEQLEDPLEESGEESVGESLAESVDESIEESSYDEGNQVYTSDGNENTSEMTEETGGVTQEAPEESGESGSNGEGSNGENSGNEESDASLLDFSSLDSADMDNIDVYLEMLIDARAALEEAYQEEEDLWAWLDAHPEYDEYVSTIQTAYFEAEALGGPDYRTQLYNYLEMQDYPPLIEERRADNQEIQNDPRYYADGKLTEEGQRLIDENNQMIDIFTEHWEACVSVVRPEFYDVAEEVWALEQKQIGIIENPEYQELCAKYDELVSTETVTSPYYVAYTNAYRCYVGMLEGICQSYDCSQFINMPAEYLPETYADHLR